MSNEPVKVLWTGGFDSTFRVCMLAIVHRVPVQPYYIVAHDRGSVGAEIQAMGRIKEQIERKDPAARALIRPTVYLESDMVPAESDIRDALRTIQQTFWIGHQYWWIADVLRRNDITEIELCAKNAGPVKALYTVNDSPFDYDERSYGKIAVLSSSVTEASRCLFGCFAFPILGYKEDDMRRLSNEHKFADVLELTWFCQVPTNGKPCGRCSPCKQAMSKGFKHRIPFQRRLLGPFKKIANQCTKRLFNSIRVR